jgi:hypothetical protein
MILADWSGLLVQFGNGRSTRGFKRHEPEQSVPERHQGDGVCAQGTPRPANPSLYKWRFAQTSFLRCSILLGLPDRL